ncbi:MAG: D-alanine aminotransferase [Alphaproteobacteria bacterium]|nr:MAG: D-alanine aminotransferase [Alphaproteobacteria bacterium]
MLSYVNNKFCSLDKAQISVNDRGYQFGDAVYEVIYYKNGKFLDLEGHLKRLRISMSRIDFELKYSDSAIITIMKRLVAENNIKHGSIYIQVSRGEYSRDHSYFNMPLKPILVILTKKIKEDFKTIIPGIKVYTTFDTRWNNPDIKTTQLLPNVLAKTKGIKNGFGEALFLDKKSYITEGSSSNFWILNKNNILITRSLDGKILAGITRDSILNCAKNKNIKVEEKKISLDNIKDCKEAFITSASSFVTPVIQVDNIKINSGKVGEFSNLLRKTYLELND